jgi:aminopeptidase YwaD
MTTLFEPSRDNLLAVVEQLSRDEYTGRRAGTPGSRAAATWLATRLRQLDAVVGLDSFSPGTAKELSATPTLQWSDVSITTDLVHRRDFVEHLGSTYAPHAIHGPLALAGDRETWGRWILSPTYSTDLVETLTRQGVAGLLVPRGTDGEGWMPKMIAGPAPANLPILWVRRGVHEQMTAAANSGRAWARASVPLLAVEVTGTNIHAVFAPPDGGISVLLTAHYDGVGDDPEARLPAAADNASGVSVVIEAGRLLAPQLPPGVGLSVALLDAEELGAQGSAHHASQIPANTHVINVDGAAQLGETAAVEAGGPAHDLLAAVDAAGRETGIALRAGSMASDNRRYAAAGIAAIGIGMGMPGYQTPAETPDRVDPETLIAATRLVVATVGHLVEWCNALDLV